MLRERQICHKKYKVFLNIVKDSIIQTYWALNSPFLRKPSLDALRSIRLVTAGPASSRSLVANLDHDIGAGVSPFVG